MLGGNAMTPIATRRRFLAHSAMTVCLLATAALGACASGGSGPDVANQNAKVKRRYEKWRAARLKEDAQLRKRADDGR